MYLSAAVPKSAAPPERADALISRVPLGKHEVVQALEIRAALPKTPVGKISKKDLCEQTQAISCFYLFARSAATVAMYFE